MAAGQVLANRASDRGARQNYLSDYATRIYHYDFCLSKRVMILSFLRLLWRGTARHHMYGAVTNPVARTLALLARNHCGVPVPLSESATRTSPLQILKVLCAYDQKFLNRKPKLPRKIASGAARFPIEEVCAIFPARLEPSVPPLRLFLIAAFLTPC